MAQFMDTTSTPQAHSDEGQPLVRPLPPGIDDLLILANDDNFYWLKREAYQDEKHQLPTSMSSQSRLLVEQGVVLADIPVGSIPGVGAMCYLVNLSGLRPRVSRPPSTPPPDKPVFNPPPVKPDDPCLRGTSPAVDDLVIFARDGRTFYWVKKCEYQRQECRLEVVEPILEEQLRLLTNQGVVVADVPGGSLPGVDDMGCLINLKVIPRLESKQEMAKKPPPQSRESLS